MKTTACIFIVLLALGSVAFADTVKLSWDEDRYADGYHIYGRAEGAAYDFSTPDYSGPDLSHTFEVNETRYWVAKTFRVIDGITEESGISNEVQHVHYEDPSPDNVYTIHIGEGGYIKITPGLSGNGIDAEINPGTSGE
jgi:hypothetical protein